MLRFPYHTNLILLTNVGIIKCEITKATDELIVCKNVEFQNIKFDGLFYLDRKSICAFQLVKDVRKEKQIKEPRTTGKILQFPGRMDKANGC